MHWILLAIEIGATVSLKLSDGIVRLNRSDSILLA